MLIRPYFWSCFLLAIGVIAGCSSREKDYERAKAGLERAKADHWYDLNKSLFSAIRDAGQLVLYEGLPHQAWEPKKLEEEKRQKKTVTLDDFPFFAVPLDVRPEDAAKLKELLTGQRSFFPWRGEKKCGGFHPDYLAEYPAGESSYRLLICFGCHEVMISGPAGSLRCDIQDETCKQLEELLKNYRKNRPPPEIEH